MTPLEAMARAHWAATCAHYVKSSGIADVMPKFDALEERVRREVIDDMRAAVLALGDHKDVPPEIIPVLVKILEQQP